MSPPKRTGIANLPLHGGKAPPWLFSLMVRLSREITQAIVMEYGSREMLKRLSDPLWFQAFGCTLGYDWHSSGLTTVTMGALKEGLKDAGREMGLFIAGGKGATSRRTPSELESLSGYLKVNPEILVYTSKMAAKVDNTALLDGYQLYHHCFIVCSDGNWAVVQQGMNEESRFARRYHWLGENVDSFICEPHHAICSETRGKTVNFIARESEAARQVIPGIVTGKTPDKTLNELEKIITLDLPARHQLLPGDFNSERLRSTLKFAYESMPADFESLLALRGVGPRTLRALGLIAELVHGAKISQRDPARFSFAHGGKDGIPFPVDRTAYRNSINYLHDAVVKAKIGMGERTAALKRLSRYLDDL